MHQLQFHRFGNLRVVSSKLPAIIDFRVYVYIFRSNRFARCTRLAKRRRRRRSQSPLPFVFRYRGTSLLCTVHRRICTMTTDICVSQLTAGFIQLNSSESPSSSAAPALSTRRRSPKPAYYLMDAIIRSFFPSSAHSLSLSLSLASSLSPLPSQLPPSSSVIIDEERGAS